MLTLILYITILVLMEAFAVNLIVRWRNDKQTYNLLGAMFIYAMVALLLAYILTNAPSVAVTNSIWQSLNIIIVTSIAIIMYKERPTKYQIIGLILAIFAVLVVSYEDILIS